MIPRRSLAVVATTASALSLAAIPGVAFAGSVPAGAAARPAATHHATGHVLRPVTRHAVRHAARHGKAAPSDATIDNTVTAQITGLPDSIQAGSPTTFSVTYTNTGSTDYPVSGLALDVVDAAQGSALTPASFTMSYQYRGLAASWASCEQEQTDDGSGDVSCYLDPGDSANSELAPNTAVTVQVQLTFAATYQADDAAVSATPVLYADENGEQEVDGASTDSNPFEVYTQ
jgi:hypothetical protein